MFNRMITAFMLCGAGVVIGDDIKFVKIVMDTLSMFVVRSELAKVSTFVIYSRFIPNLVLHGKIVAVIDNNAQELHRLTSLSIISDFI